MRQSSGTTPVSSDFWNHNPQSAFAPSEGYESVPFNSTTTQHPNMKSFDITCNGITKLLKQLNPYKAPGPGNISPRILKELATDISPLLQSSVVWDVFSEKADSNWRFNIFDLVTGSQYSLPSIFSDEIPTMSLRLCLIYVQDFFIPDRGSFSSGVTVRLSGYLLSMMFEIVILFLSLTVTQSLNQIY
jgi:hypothetical protein